MRRIVARTALCLAVSACDPLFAEETQDVHGRVLDRTGTIGFEGAVVRAPDLGLEAVTTRDGRYRLALPPGRHVLVIEYLGAEREQAVLSVPAGRSVDQDFRIGEDVSAVQNVLIVGQAAGQAGALNRQRTSDRIVNVVSSDAIGQFPDQNVAESLQRVPGLSLFRDQGEGRFVVIRGIDPALNSTTINGLRVPGPESDSRQVNLDVISSDLLESLEVSKSMTADMDGDAVGGNVELKSATAFDRGNSLALRAEGSHNDLRSKTSPKLSGAFTRLASLGSGVDNLGMAGALSWFKRRFGSDNVETDGFETLEGPESEFLGLEEAEQRDYTITRERLSGSLNFDFRPGPDTDLSWYTLYSDFSDTELQRTNTFVFGDGDVAALSPQQGTFTGATVEKLSEGRREDQRILSSVLGLTRRQSATTFDAKLGYAEAREDQPEALNFAFVGEGVDTAYSLRNPQKPRLSGSGDAFSDPTTYVLDQIEQERTDTKEQEASLALDLTHAFSIGRIPMEGKLGAKTRQRQKQANTQAVIFDGFGDSDVTLANFPTTRIDYALGDFGVHPERQGLVDFFRAGRSAFEVDAEDSAIASQGEDYDLHEDIYAGYGMLTADLGRVRLIGGVRAEHTRVRARGVEVRTDEESGEGDAVFSRLSGEKRYTDVLPSLSLRFDMDDRTVLRAALSRTLARPGFEAAAPRAAIEITEDDGEFERSAELGNPALDPLRSTNVDVSVEHYPGGLAQISAGVFVKSLRDFFVLSDVAGQRGAFQDFDEALIVLNGDQARVVGVEFAYAQRLSMLPPPFDGLLLNANLTCIQSKAELPFRERDVRLPRQSDTLGNVSIGYQNPRLSLRLAASYRDDFLDEIGDLDDPSTDRYAKDHLQLDFTSSLRVSDHYQVYLNAVNLNDEPFYAYFSDRRFASQYEEYGPTFELGVKANF